MTAKNNECRFCLKTFNESDKTNVIDDAIRESFKFVTQIELKSAAKYSRVVCEMCLRSLQLSHAVIVQFSENQRKLESRMMADSSQSQKPATASTSSDPLALSAIKIVDIKHEDFKEEPDIEVIRYEPSFGYRDRDEQEEEEESAAVDYNDFECQNVGSQATNRTKLNKDEKNFWHMIIDKTGYINPSVLYILQMNGYNSVYAFQGHFAAEVNTSDLLTSLQQSVRALDPQSEHVKNIQVAARKLDSFEFTLGERCMILGLFEKIRNILRDGTLAVKDEVNESSLQSRTKYNLEPEHLQETIETVLRQRMKNYKLDFPIVKKFTKSFPYSIWIKCAQCHKALRITVTEDRKANGRKNINIRTHHCVAHIKNCYSLA